MLWPPEQIFVCVIVLLTVAMFVWEKFSPDVVAMCSLFLLVVVPFHGHPILLPGDKHAQAEILGSVFGNRAILTLSFMFIVGAAVDKSGLIEVLGRWFETIAGRGGRRALLALGMLAISVSAFLNNTTVVVVFIPMVLGLCRRVQLMPSRFLIPLSYFAIAGGLCTMIGTSTNILVNGIVAQKELPPFSMFEITPLGVTLAATILVFLVLFAPKLLADRPSLAVLIDSEKSHEFLLAAIVGQDSPMAGHKLADTPMSAIKRLRVIEVRRSGNRIETPLNELVFEAGDRIIFKCHLSGVTGQTDVASFEQKLKTELGLAYVHTEQAVLMEGMIGPQSDLVGRSLVNINFRQQYGVLIVALHREGENQRENFEHLKLEVGDTLLLEGSKERMKELFESEDFINLSEVKPQRKPAAANAAAGGPAENRCWVAMLALGLVVVCGAYDAVPFEWVAMGAALLVVLGGCLTKDEIYDAIEWRIITMIIGTIALGVAMDRSGAAKSIVHSMLSVIGDWDRRFILSAVLALTIVLAELLSHSAVAALLTPLTIQLAADLGVEPRPFIAAVMVGASMGFALPTAYQTHMLVYSAGGYKFGDFFKIGIALDVVCWITGSIAIPMIWP